MNSLDWSNEEMVFKKKPKLCDVNNTLDLIKTKWETIFSIDSISNIIVLSIEENTNYISTIESVYIKIQQLYKEFLTWTLSILIIATQRYLRKEYSTEIKKSLSWLYDILISIPSQHIIELINTQLIIISTFVIRFINSFVNSIDRKNRIYTISLGRFINLDVNYLFQKPKVYWCYGDRVQSIEFIEETTQENSHWIMTQTDWDTYNEEHILVFDYSSYSSEIIKDIVNGNILFILSVNNGYKMVLSKTIYIFSSSYPDILEDYNLTNDSIIKFETNNTSFLYNSSQ
tara:strand:+ start:13267 stop:14127 length:861 start_codon:yes stop_codon:yes gene_type:complete